MPSITGGKHAAQRTTVVEYFAHFVEDFVDFDVRGSGFAAWCTTLG